MQISLYGGFGEKGRTCVGVESGGYRVLLDAGVMTSARGYASYHPAIGAEALRAHDAIVLAHAHEDHVGALGFCIANGFRGRIFMTPFSMVMLWIWHLALTSLDAQLRRSGAVPLFVTVR